VVGYPKALILCLKIQSVQLPKSAVFTITPAIRCLCTREFLPNSKMTKKMVDGTSAHLHRPIGVVVTTQKINIKKLIMVIMRQSGEAKMSTNSSQQDHY
jgi:hypothetical protein